MLLQGLNRFLTPVLELPHILRWVLGGWYIVKVGRNILSMLLVVSLVSRCLIRFRLWFCFPRGLLGHFWVGRWGKVQEVSFVPFNPMGVVGLGWGFVRTYTLGLDNFLKLSLCLPGLHHHKRSFVEPRSNCNPTWLLRVDHTSEKWSQSKQGAILRLQHEDLTTGKVQYCPSQLQSNNTSGLSCRPHILGQMRYSMV